MNKIFKKNKVILGLMRVDKISAEELADLIQNCLSLGIHYFDVSDVYLNHEAEKKLGKVLLQHPEFRKDMIIQTKCGIVKDDAGKITRIDLSKEHIISSCKDSLKRMNLDTIDVFLLHRVDIFMDNKEIAKAVSHLYRKGMIRHFGLSNMDVSMMEYLKETIDLPLEVNQLQLSLGQPSLISQAFNVNFPQQVPNLADGIFFYLKKNHIALQCWSPYQVGFFQGSIFDKKNNPALGKALDQLAQKYQTTPCAIATSFLSMLGDNVQVITGSMNLSHIKETISGSNLIMSKEDWYSLYLATGNLLP